MTYLNFELRIGATSSQGYSVHVIQSPVGETMRRGGETAHETGKRAYQKLMRAAQATVQQAEAVLDALQDETNQQA